MSSMRGGLRAACVLWAAGLCLGGAAAAAGGPAVTVKELDGKLRVEIGGELFTEYLLKGFAKPILYPVLGPGGVPMTRNYPMAKVPGEASDHVHQKSMWFTHGDVNGVDFWAEGKTKGTIVNTDVLRVTQGGAAATIVTANKWVKPDGAVVCTDTTRLAFTTAPGRRIIDFEITLQASNGDVVLGDTKEGTMAIRTHSNLCLKNNPGVTTANGRAVNSEGVRDAAVWGKRARWIDYWGEIDGKTVGIAILDNPRNPRHPTWWHARDYGLIAVNPFGIHDFERKPARTGDFRIPAGESRVFSYRFVFHEGDVEAAGVEALYDAYATAGAAPPEGWKLVYRQTFDAEDALEDFEFTDASKWLRATPDGNGCLETLGLGAYQPKVRSPAIIALLSKYRFEDFILEADLLQTGREYGHRDMCVFFGFTDPEKFYYVHMATEADPNAHNIFIVDGKPRVNIATKTTGGVAWGSEVWHRVRVERTCADGAIKVFFDDMTTPIMLASDATFGEGWIGFGSFDDPGRIDNVSIWAPKAVERSAGFFAKK